MVFVISMKACVILESHYAKSCMLLGCVQFNHSLLSASLYLASHRRAF